MKEMLNKYFSRSEFACSCGCGFRTVDVEMLDVLTDLREHFGEPVRSNSGCRCEKHNQAIGGSSRSKHIFACADDITVDNVSPEKVYDYLDKRYPVYGLGLHKTFVHFDIRSTKWRQIYHI